MCSLFNCRNRSTHSQNFLCWFVYYINRNFCSNTYCFMSRSNSKRQRFDKKPCSINVRRTNVAHICFVDMDTFPNFFAILNEQSNSASVIFKGNVFFIAFLSKQIASDVLQWNSFYSLFTNQRLEVRIHDGHTAENPFAAQESMLKEIAHWHNILKQTTTFTVLGGNHNNIFDSSFSYLKGSCRDFVYISIEKPWLDGWLDVLLQCFSQERRLETHKCIQRLSTKPMCNESLE